MNNNMKHEQQMPSTEFCVLFSASKYHENSSIFPQLKQNKNADVFYCMYNATSFPISKTALSNF